MASEFLSTKIADTGNLRLPKGTTAQRPGSPEAGMIRFNTDIDATELYDGTNWVTLSSKGPKYNHASVVSLTGGTHVENSHDGYKTHYFLSGMHTFTPSKSGPIEILVVGGGGGGGSDGAGGGAGGLLYKETFDVVSGTSYDLAIGKGGFGSTSNDYSLGSGGPTYFGSNLVTNGDFSSDFTGWTRAAGAGLSQFSIVDGRAYLSGRTSGGYDQISQTIAVENGATYTFNVEIERTDYYPWFSLYDVTNSTSLVSVQLHTSVGYGGAGTIYNMSHTFTATGTSVKITIGGNSPYGDKAYFDNISLIKHDNDSLVALGGGAGASRANKNGINGASGGGAGGIGPSGSAGSGTSGQGFDGGAAYDNGLYSGYGGGGGAGGVGKAATIASKGGNGGPGIGLDISGELTYYAGGGGGGMGDGTGSSTPCYGGRGGIGGGGDGASYNVEALAGKENTGGGGGGGARQGGFVKGANGGSGIVIIKYPDDSPKAIVQEYDNPGDYKWVCPPEVNTIEVLVVAGGGGGGGTPGASTSAAGGGGAGGLIHQRAYSVTPGTVYSIGVGEGGAGGVGDSSDSQNGSNSNFASLTASGGGRGGDRSRTESGGNGGSGGGGAWGSTSNATGTENQGNLGGASGAANGGGGDGGGGGGGAGEAGNDALLDGHESGANGGNGLPIAITGVCKYYAGGGGGGTRFNNGYTFGKGGLGGGGDGGDRRWSRHGRNGDPGTGGGGGGASTDGATQGSGGKGGCGIVVLKWYP